MTMFDNSPERRNLNILSVSIILYYLADGYIMTDGQAKVEMLNIGFRNTEVLQYSIIIFLLWFLFRYWLVERGAASENYKNEICRINVAGLYKFFVDNSVENTVIRFQLCDKETASTSNGITQASGARLIKLVGFGGAMVRSVVTIKMFFTKPTLTGYAVPYVLSFLALGLISTYLLFAVLTVIGLIMYKQN